MCGYFYLKETQAIREGGVTGIESPLPERPVQQTRQETAPADPAHPGVRPWEDSDVMKLRSAFPGGTPGPRGLTPRVQARESSAGIRDLQGGHSGERKCTTLENIAFWD